jgi:hypothetical protein
MTTEKDVELAQDIVETIRENTIDQIADDVREALEGQLATACNEVLAQIAWESFTDGCDGYDVPCYLENFRLHFPTYAELL